LCRTASEENPRCLARHSSIPSRHENDPPGSARGVSGGPASRVLREITDSAGANVASVSYHFGSLQALCDAAIEQALEQYLDAQIQALSSLDAAATVSELAAAVARPMMRALAAGGQELAVMRTVARVGIDPPQGWERLEGKFEQARSSALRVLTARLPEVEERELVFRTRCAAGLLNWLALTPIGGDLAANPSNEIERLLVPVVAGAAQALRRDQATARAPGRERIPWARSRCVAGDHCDDAKRVDHIVPMLQQHDLARREYPVAAQSN
jgi:AcrR family transcriptional regulator